LESAGKIRLHFTLFDHAAGVLERHEGQGRVASRSFKVALLRSHQVLQKCDIPEADLEQLAAGGQHVLQVWRVLQQPSIKRQVIVMLADMPLPRQFEPDLLVLNVVESVL